MARNVVLALSSLAVLIVLFAAYALLTDQPGAERAGPAPMDQVPRPDQATTQPLQIGPDVRVPGGGRIVFRRYDERTGRPTDLFSCDDWQPVAGSKHEIRATRPELALLLPSGMIATVSADEGQLAVDRVEQSQMRPKQGWLDGHARIVIDRATSPQRTPQDERPEDLITMDVGRLEFDLEAGELKTPEHVTVRSNDFDIAGTGLVLVWNQADNRVEKLLIERGEQFVLYAASGLFGAVGGESEGQGTESATPATAGAGEPAAQNPAAGAAAPLVGPAGAPKKPPRHRAAERKLTTYVCSLTGGVTATQYRGDERLGNLQADEVQLLFDAGGQAGTFLKAPSATSRPMSRPPHEQTERLEVQWNGRLQLTSTAAPTKAGPSRRHFTALGRPVVLTRGQGLVRCGKLEYEDETRRIWLEPLAGGTVEFGMGANLSATAQSVYVDWTGRLVKLVGDVELRSRRGTGAAEKGSSIRAAYWGELHLAESASTTQPLTDAVVDFDRLESAKFVGEVRVDLGQQTLTAHQLDVTFFPTAGGQSLEKQIDTATASGDVHLASGKGAVDCAELELVFELTPEEEPYPGRMHAVGSVVIARDKAYVRGNQVTAELAPPPPQGPRTGGPEFVIRSLDVLGQAELYDPDNKVAARGQQIAADFVGINQLTTATVLGTAQEQARVHATPYTVRGGRVDLDRDRQTLHVDGPSRLAFETRRSLQGQQRSEPAPVVVTSTQVMHIDGRANTIRFVGNVAAATAEEQLRGDTLTLLLEDVPEPASPTSQRAPTTLGQQLGGTLAGLAGLPTRSSWTGLWRQTRSLVGSKGGKTTPAGPRDDLFDFRAADQSERIRKEPVRLLADNALVTSESYAADETEPSVDASISAPRLEVDIVHRQILTTGLTELLMIDRRGIAESNQASDALGLPSALLTRGASQTAMRCEGGMVYTLGPEGAGREDTAVFQDRVVFVHCSGQEMVNLDEMLPRSGTNGLMTDSAKSRRATLDCDRLECWFRADSAADAERRGGALTRTPLQLASLLARGSVYLRDQQASRIRDVHADAVEFSRDDSRIQVQGGAGVAARVYFEDSQTGQSDAHAGPQIVINLKDGTIRSGRIEGQLRRPR